MQSFTAQDSRYWRQTSFDFAKAALIHILQDCRRSQRWKKLAVQWFSFMF